MWKYSPKFHIIFLFDLLKLVIGSKLECKLWASCGIFHHNISCGYKWTETQPRKHKICQLVYIHWVLSATSGGDSSSFIWGNQLLQVCIHMCGCVWMWKEKRWPSHEKAPAGVADDLSCYVSYAAWAVLSTSPSDILHGESFDSGRALFFHCRELFIYK